MVDAMHTAHVGAVNAYPPTKPVASAFCRTATSKIARIDRDQKVGRAGTIRPVILIASTSLGTVVAATRAPNLMCRQIAAQYGDAQLVDIVTPALGGLRADELIVATRRLLHVREPDETPSGVMPVAFVRALKMVRLQDAMSRSLGRVRASVRRSAHRLLRGALS